MVQVFCVLNWMMYFMNHKMISYQNIRCIVADLDGTLLNEAKELDKDIKGIIEKLRKKDILFTLATGRNVQIMKNFIEELDIKIPYIVNNGACIYQGNQNLYEQTMDEVNLSRALKIFSNEDIPFIAYNSQAIYVHGDKNILHPFLQRLKGKTVMNFGMDSSNIAKQGIFKIVAVNDDNNNMLLIQALVNDTCRQVRCLRSEDNIYTITHIDATKGKALTRIMKDMDIPLENVLVFGDNFNDVSMFEVAGIAVAMDNAEESIKINADAIASSNSICGVSQFIKEHILIK